MGGPGWGPAGRVRGGGCLMKYPSAVGIRQRVQATMLERQVPHFLDYKLLLYPHGLNHLLYTVNLWMFLSYRGRSSQK